MFTLDIAETPSRAYTRFDIRPSELRDMTLITISWIDLSDWEASGSTKKAMPTSKKPEKLMIKLCMQQQHPNFDCQYNLVNQRKAIELNTVKMAFR